MESYELAKVCCRALSDKKGEDIVILDIREQTTLCSYFVIASGKSATQVRALAENVEEAVKKKYELAPVRTEGLKEGSWSVLDYGDVVVHVFSEQSRLFYYLERLWDSGKNVEHFEE